MTLLLRDIVISCAKVRNIIITAKEKSKKKCLVSIIFCFYRQHEGKYCKRMPALTQKDRNRQKFFSFAV